MAKYKAVGPDGNTYEMEGPDNATPEQVKYAFARKFPQARKKTAPQAQPAPQAQKPAPLAPPELPELVTPQLPPTALHQFSATSAPQAGPLVSPVQPTLNQGPITPEPSFNQGPVGFDPSAQGTIQAYPSDIAEEQRREEVKQKASEMFGIGKRLPENLKGLAQYSRETLPAEIAQKVGVEMEMPKTGAALAGLTQATASMTPITPVEIGLQALGIPILKAGGKFIKGPVVDMASEAIAHIAGAGTSPEAIRLIFNNPKSMLHVGRIMADIEQNRLVQAIQNGKTVLGQKISAVEKPFADTATVKLENAFQNSKNFLQEEMRTTIPKITDVKKRLVSRLDNASEIEIITNFMKKMKRYKEMPFGDVKNMIEQISEKIDFGQGGLTLSDPAQAMLKKMRSELTTALTGSVPKEFRSKWLGARKVYSDAMVAFDMLRKQAIGTSPEVTARKLMSALRSGRFETVAMERAGKIGQKAAKELEEAALNVATSQFKPWVKGLTFGSFGIIPTSPRLFGYGTALAGALKQPIQSSIPAIAQFLMSEQSKKEMKQRERLNIQDKK